MFASRGSAPFASLARATPFASLTGDLRGSVKINGDERESAGVVEPDVAGKIAGGEFERKRFVNRVNG